MVHQPLSERSVEWLQRYGTPSSEFIERCLTANIKCKKSPASAEEIVPLVEHSKGLANAFNLVINVVLNHEAETEGEHRSYRQLAGQLNRGKTMAEQHLRTEANSWHEPINLSDAQMGALMQVYSAWCARVGLNIGAKVAQR